MINYPVRAAGDGTDRIIDAAGQELGTVEIRDSLNAGKEPPMLTLTEDQIKYMVDRFLMWRLPSNFSPDAGISYKRPNYPPSVDATPTGTNLFDATQADVMVRYMIGGAPISSDHPQARPHHEAEYVPGRGTWGELT